MIELKIDYDLKGFKLECGSDVMKTYASRLIGATELILKYINSSNHNKNQIYSLDFSREASKVLREDGIKCLRSIVESHNDNFDYHKKAKALRNTVSDCWGFGVIKQTF